MGHMALWSHHHPLYSLLESDLPEHYELWTSSCLITIFWQGQVQVVFKSREGSNFWTFKFLTQLTACFRYHASCVMLQLWNFEHAALPKDSLSQCYLQSQHAKVSWAYIMIKKKISGSAQWCPAQRGRGDNVSALCKVIIQAPKLLV